MKAPEIEISETNNFDICKYFNCGFTLAPCDHSNLQVVVDANCWRSHVMPVYVLRNANTPGFTQGRVRL